MIAKGFEEMIIPKTREDADRLLKRLCEIEIELAKIETKKNAAHVKAEAEAAAAGAPHLREKLAIRETLERWFAGERGKLPEGKKSLSMNFGKLGIRARDGVELVRHWTWELVVAALKGRELGRYLRQVEVVNKNAVLAATDEELKTLEACGLKVKRGEKFFVKPALERLSEEAVSHRGTEA